MIVAYDIGGTRIRAARVAGVEVTPLGEVPTPTTEFGDFLESVGRFATGATGIALSVAGVVDPATARIKVANIPCADGRALGPDLEAALGLPVKVLNDADCFALAEAHHGAGRGHRNVFGIILGTGVGGGLVIDGRVITGAGGFAGEWGHGPVLTGDLALPCGCGQTGCLDTIGGARGIERLHRLRGRGEAGSEAIVAGWRRGDAAASDTVSEWAERVAGPLAMVLNVVGASIVPAGGGLARANDLIAALDLAVRARVLRPSAEPLVRPAGCPGEPALIGAAAAFQERA
ncbi:ROK family protein [Neotabrizicola shimadae]|uniref:ROK family protein n=1 Tax=Neotabrizicola shimadae TaxID=2807096 RepID=A0A8G0ZUA8_9RHOB|nr:ROK family protein [Neotabrizicola shimadae]QYZ69036.1 ROK family protein [Neotabrizicola shimadae]